MDNLVSLLKATGSAAVNEEVKNKILELTQSWATATEGRLELNYIGETYKGLQREGYGFPPKVDVASSMLDSSAVRYLLIDMMFYTLTIFSPQSGVTQMCVCDVELRLASRTESTTAEIVEMSLTNSAPQKHYHSLTWVSYSQSESTMGATLN